LTHRSDPPPKDNAVRRRALAIVVVAAGLLLAGCTGNEPEATDSEAAETGEATEDTVDEEATGDRATSDPSPDDEGRKGSTVDGDLGEPADASEAARRIEVDAFDMAFDPASIAVEPGEVVTFEVTNTGAAVHEFFLGDATMQQEHAEEMAAMGHGMAHDEPYSIRLDPGETKELTWRFADGGDVEFACHEPGHYQAGMHGRIRVG
jgi:uncharacterized cupredoxin-like copper-binding protein